MLIRRDRSIIPACDVDLSRLEDIVSATAKIPEIGAYKLGFVLGLSVGLPKAVEVIRRYTNKPIIYDHQKAATDIPATGSKFARVCREAGVDAVMFFPQSGPVTQKEWIEAARSEKLSVIIGAAMTHPSFVESEGGYIADSAIERIYLNAVDDGIVDFVLPGTRPDMISQIRKVLEGRGILPTIYSPGLGAQGGDMMEASRVAGPRWHAIIGRAIYDAPDIAEAVHEFVGAMRALEER